MVFRDMRNSFNLLLIALSLFDTCYLAGAILESMRKSFGVHSEWQTLLFPGRHAHTNANQFISKEAGFLSRVFVRNEVRKILWIFFPSSLHI